MRRKQNGWLNRVLVAPVVCVLAVRVLDEPVTNIEALVGEIAGLPDGEAVRVATEDALWVLGISHYKYRQSNQ